MSRAFAESMRKSSQKIKELKRKLEDAMRAFDAASE